MDLNKIRYGIVDIGVHSLVLVSAALVLLVHFNHVSRRCVFDAQHFDQFEAIASVVKVLVEQGNTLTILVSSVDLVLIKGIHARILISSAFNFFNLKYGPCIIR